MASNKRNIKFMFGTYDYMNI